MAVQIQLRRDLATNWTSINPILAEGQEGLELDTGKRKIGDGATAWNSLTYMATGLVDGDYGDVTVSGSGSTITIDPGVVTLAQQADVATGTVFYRKTAGTGSPEVQTLATLKTDLAYTASDVGAVPDTRTVNGHALNADVTVTASDVGLGSVTNDAQTKAAIVPNTVPSAGQILAGNAGGTAYAPVSMSGGATMDSTGAVTLSVSNSDITTAVSIDPKAVRDALRLGPQYRFEAYIDGTSPPTGSASSGFYAVALSSGAVAVTSVQQANSVGYLSLTTQTSTASKAAVVGNANSMYFGNGQAYWRSRQQLGSLSDATDTFTVRIGFNQQSASATQQGAYFRYTDSVNSGKWQAVTVDNGVETATDTGITAVAGTDRLFEITVNAAGTSVEFKIDGAVVATNTTNIPTNSNRLTGYGVAVNRSAGTTAKIGVYLDYAYVRVDFTTTR